MEFNPGDVVRLSRTAKVDPLFVNQFMEWSSDETGIITALDGEILQSWIRVKFDSGKNTVYPINQLELAPVHTPMAVEFELEEIELAEKLIRTG